MSALLQIASPFIVPLEIVFSKDDELTRSSGLGFIIKLLIIGDSKIKTIYC